MTVNVHLNTSPARDGSTKLHFDIKKTPLSQVTIEQWGYASLKEATYTIQASTRLSLMKQQPHARLSKDICE
jgi:hypothetical protein